MLNKDKLTTVLERYGDLSEGQRELLLSAAETEIPEKELFEKLGMDEKRFAEILMAASDVAVLTQELSADDFESVTGGTTKADRDFYELRRQPGYPNGYYQCDCGDYFEEYWYSGGMSFMQCPTCGKKAVC